MAPLKIGTHNGTFHCDEVLACAMLKHLPEYKDATITRTRDKDVLAEQDIVVDVGGEYVPEKHRYDHHQRGFTEVLEGYNTKLSSAGLVYRHFGKRVLQAIAPSLEGEILDMIYDKIYTSFVEGVDGIDNGVLQYPSDVKSAYSLSTHLSNRVGNFNPYWNEDSSDIDERFARAMAYVDTEFTTKVNYYVKAWLPARTLVVDAMASKTEVHSSGRILKYAQVGPWKEHLFGLEEKEGIAGHTLYVLYPDSNGAWRVQCVPKEAGSFENRLSLPEPWRGVRDDALSELSGIPDCIFIHAGGFIGGAKTYESALALAVKSLEIAGVVKAE